MFYCSSLFSVACAPWSQNMPVFNLRRQCQLAGPGMSCTRCGASCVRCPILRGCGHGQHRPSVFADRNESQTLLLCLLACVCHLSNYVTPFLHLHAVTAYAVHPRRTWLMDSFRSILYCCDLPIGYMERGPGSGFGRTVT